MAIIGVGVDVVDIDRFVATLDRTPGLLDRLFTAAERKRSHASLAARFAAKEAISKALGTGMRGVAWREMEVVPDRRGKPLVRLHGRAQARADDLRLREFAISLTHSQQLAIAFVVATT